MTRFKGNLNINHTAPVALSKLTSATPISSFSRTWYSEFATVATERTSICLDLSANYGRISSWRPTRFNSAETATIFSGISARWCENKQRTDVRRSRRGLIPNLSQPYKEWTLCGLNYFKKTKQLCKASRVFWLSYPPPSLPRARSKMLGQQEYMSDLRTNWKAL